MLTWCFAIHNALAHMIKHLCTFLVCMSLCGFVSAHEETSLVWDASGHVQGFPEQYGPAHLEISLDPSRPQAPRLVRLKVGTKSYQLDPCELSFLDADLAYDVRLSSSWYHSRERSGLPPYLNVTLLITDKQPPAESRGVTLLFSLESAQLLHAWELSPADSPSVFRRPIDLPKKCPADGR
jgi:hypothetical protein